MRERIALQAIVDLVKMIVRRAKQLRPLFGRLRRLPVVISQRDLSHNCHARFGRE
jgi:hypothetical protein